MANVNVCIHMNVWNMFLQVTIIVRHSFESKTGRISCPPSDISPNFEIFLAKTCPCSVTSNWGVEGDGGSKDAENSFGVSSEVFSFSTFLFVIRFFSNLLCFQVHL